MTGVKRGMVVWAHGRLVQVLDRAPGAQAWWVDGLSFPVASREMRLAHTGGKA